MLAESRQFMYFSVPTVSGIEKCYERQTDGKIEAGKEERRGWRETRKENSVDLE